MKAILEFNMEDSYERRKHFDCINAENMRDALLEISHCIAQSDGDKEEILKKIASIIHKDSRFKLADILFFRF